MENKTTITVREKYRTLQPFFNERTKRLWAAAESKSIGRGGKTMVCLDTGLSRVTFNRGLHELSEPAASAEKKRVRSTGGGRKRLTEHSPDVVAELKTLIEDTTRGDPESPLLWTCKSTRKLAEELTVQGYKIGRQKISELLAEADYSLQSNRKIKEGTSHPDRDKQFRYLNGRVKQFQRWQQPVISVDTKKKELIGEFAIRGVNGIPKGSHARQTAMILVRIALILMEFMIRRKTWVG